MTADEIKIAGEILQRHWDNPEFSVWDASLASMEEYAIIKARKELIKYMKWLHPLHDDEQRESVADMYFKDNNMSSQKEGGQ